MSVTQQDIDALRQELSRLAKEADSYFERVDAATQAEQAASPSTYSFDRRIDADFISDKDRNDLIPKLSADLGRLVLKIVEASKATPLVSEVDHKDLRLALRRMLAALRIYRYQHWETNVVQASERLRRTSKAPSSNSHCADVLRRVTSGRGTRRDLGKL